MSASDLSENVPSRNPLAAASFRENNKINGFVGPSEQPPYEHDNERDSKRDNERDNERNNERDNERDNQNLVSPLRSADSFEIYCSKIQQRLGEQAVKRVLFLKGAHDRLTRLMQAARAVDDSALFQELALHRETTRELLDAIGQIPSLSPSAGITPVPIPSAPGPLKPLPIQSIVNRPVTTPPVQEMETPAAKTPLAQEECVSAAGISSEPTPRLPRRALRPLADIEADALRLREELRHWNESRPLTNRQGGLDAPNCLLLRAVACKQRRLEEEAGDTEVAEVTELRDDIIDLLDGANDQDYTVALDDELDPIPTAYQWGEMAERYEEMARGQEAFEWWQKHRNALTVAEIQPLAEAIAAIQQRFNRILFRVGARDPFQQALFDALRTWAREAQCYLQSLRPKVPTAELSERAATLEQAWERAREVVLEEGRRCQVLENLITMVTDPDFGSAPDEDEERLRGAVLECKQHRVPPSDRRLRDAVLPWAAFLEGDERFRDVLREIHLEWERRQDQGRPEEAAEGADHSLDAVWLELEAVRDVTRGKRCLILGGTCREENRRKIEEALELRELVWPSTKPSDPLSKYDSEIRRSEMVALLTRFSRKEWKSAQDICARDGKQFVHLTSGYGVAQVVRHFYRQICPDPNSSATR